MPRNNFVLPSPTARGPTVRGSPELESAKTALRRRGFVVYDAEVTGGPRGYVSVDGKVVPRSEVIAMAMERRK